MLHQVMMFFFSSSSPPLSWHRWKKITADPSGVITEYMIAGNAGYSTVRSMANGIPNSRQVFSFWFILFLFQLRLYRNVQQRKKVLYTKALSMLFPHSLFGRKRRNKKTKINKFPSAPISEGAQSLWWCTKSKKFMLRDVSEQPA